MVAAIIVGSLILYGMDESSQNVERQRTLDDFMGANDDTERSFNSASAQNSQRAVCASSLSDLISVHTPPKPAKHYSVWPIPSNSPYYGKHETFVASGANLGGLRGDQPTIFFCTDKLIEKSHFMSAIYFVETNALCFFGQDGVLRVPIDTFVNVFEDNYSQAPRVSIRSPNEEHFYVPLEIVR